MYVMPYGHILNNFLLFIFIIVIFAENASFTRKLRRHLLALMAPWIIEHRGMDRKRARPTILNVWRFANPLKYSGLRAAGICIAQQVFVWYPYRGKLYG